MENLEIISHSSHKGPGKDKLNYSLRREFTVIALSQLIHIEWLMCQSYQANN